MQVFAEWNAFYLAGNWDKAMLNSFSSRRSKHLWKLNYFSMVEHIPKNSSGRLSLCVVCKFFVTSTIRWWYTITFVVSGRCGFGPENVHFHSLNREKWIMCRIWFNLPIKFQPYTINLPAIVHYWNQIPNKRIG